MCSNEELKTLIEEVREDMRRYQTANRMAMDRQDKRIKANADQLDEHTDLFHTAVFTQADFEAALLRTVWRVITDKRTLGLLIALALIAGLAGDGIQWVIEVFRTMGGGGLTPIE